MPSDFISLLSADIDPSSPKSLYSKESVYDLLPKELQLPSVVQQDNPTMSQKSGGEAGPPPPAALASDAAATCAAASSPGGLSSTFPSCPSMLTATSAPEQACRLHSGPAAEGMPERMGVEPGSVVAISAVDTVVATQSQATPSKRRTVLSISPPPEDLLDDSCMSCQDDLLANQDSEQSSSMWMDDSVSNFSVGSSSSYNDNTEVPRKSRKRTPRQRPGPKPAARDEAGMDVFDADSAKAPHFVLSQLGSDTKVTPKVSSLEVSNNQKGGILSIQYPQKNEGKELKILIQPETQHRARYLTEGSRGSVKDRTQQGFPTIKLEGVNEPVVLQVFVANDAGRVKPHGFYQACRVTGRNTTACKEVDIEGTTVIEVNFEPTNSMTQAVDCVGILKLRNADVEARIGVAGSKKKSTRARLAFRVNIPRPDGSVLTLQALSSPILCTQPAGVPEILKKSLHSGSVAGGVEVFIIGKNFLKGTKVIFQENSTEESGWQAEAEIDMELFHQNHLVVKVPPYHDQTLTSSVSVGIAVVTNAGRTHDLQPFTYTPLTEKVELPVKSELPATVKACTFEEQIKAMQTETNCLNSVLMLPMVKREEPMEVSCNAAPSDIFKPVEALSSTQQILEISTVLPSATKSFPSPVALQSVDSQLPSAQIFTTQETLSTIQKQDIPSPTSFQVSLSEDTTVLQPVPPQVPQQFLRETPETLSPEDNSADGSGMVLVGIDSRNPPSQRPQVQVLLPQDGVAQLERAVRELQAQQQLNSVLYSPTPSAESLQQHVQENMNSLRLGGNETTLINQQQQQQEQNILENLQQQQQKALVDLQHQQTVLENLQQHQKVFENFQQQALGNIQQQQTHKVLENLQHQQQHQNVLENIQQQSSIVTLQHQKVLDNLQQQQQHQKNLETLQHQEVLENLKQQLQSELLQTQIPMQCTPSFASEQQSSTQTNTLSQPSEGFLQNPTQEQLQQQAALFQQTGGLLTIQTSSFLQQPSSQPSPPQPLFQSHNPLTETQDSQTVLFGTTKSPQVQATLFPGTMTMLTSTNLPTDQQGPPASLFIAQSVLPSQLSSDNNQNQQQQQITFLTPMQTSGTEAQTVSLFQGQAQLSTPMEQQQSPQQQQMATPQQAPLFPNIATISPNQAQQQTQTGILFCTTTINPHDLPQALLFSGQNQASLGSDRLPENIFQEQQPMQVVPSSENVAVNNPSNQPTTSAAQPTPNPSIIFPQPSVVSVAQQDSTEPMSFQDQSTIVSDSSASMSSTRTELFQDQQPMQVVSSATTVTPVSPTDQHSVNIFLPQSAISVLQGGVSAQELPPTATAATIFSGQSGVAVGGLQNTTSSTPQQPPSQLFQTAIGGTLSQPGQPGQAGLYLFEIPSECGPLMNSPDSSLSDQLVTMGHPGSDQTQFQTGAQIHPLLDQSNNLDDKIDELLERFQEQRKTLPRDFLDH
ncbi:nuclear factor of activated T-cells 5-like isoform X1 [Sinocyclocheilus anshuiensis]|uniref:nuclear factor of activated T-cells 5-like isoform X1 n=1 Tax=Sinocyclocheilus anshuiensis TaxID=1608454 RepID=UPI0007B7B816|nr:PREDICTED: nuclear factor of activated T-cells 5-like isoform X1 [Sinocyclocheilus anshuiensis]XP_016342024.1 PREDICTED: nuclear factor of activated T-cells 5-like isoform X1 [Sinocyclocheilus anshuiensis]